MTNSSTTTRGLLAVISGPSGAGKTTICDRLVREPNVRHAVSATTRPPRRGEKDGIDYHFLTREQFEQRIAAGDFVEHAVILDHLYGTLVSEVDDAIARGETVIIDADVQGGLQLMESRPDAIFIFLQAPDTDALERRLNNRGTESAGERARRLELANRELAYSDQYDYCIVNDDLDRAVDEILDILRRGEKPSKSQNV